MSLSIERNKPFLELLATTKDKNQKQALLEIATPGQLRALCECVRSICKGRFNFTPEQKNKLLSHSKTLCQLALSSQIPLIDKQNILQKLLNDEQNESVEGNEDEQSDSESEDENTEKSEDVETEENSEDSESEDEEESFLSFC